MFRAARKLDLDPEFEKDEEKLDLETKWLAKRKAGDLLSVETKADSIISVIAAALFWTLFFGTMVSIILIYITRSLYSIPVGYITTYLILAFKFREPYAKVEFDLNSETFMYDGIIEFGGHIRKVRYLGDIRIIERSQLVEKRGKRYLRFVTNSGYLRLPDPEKIPLALRHKLEELELLPKDEIHEQRNGWNVLMETEYDRKEYFQKLREEREARAEELRIARAKALEEEYERQFE